MPRQSLENPSLPHVNQRPRKLRFRLTLTALPAAVVLFSAPVILSFMLLLAVRAGAMVFAPSVFTDALSPYQAIAPGQPGATLDAYPCEFLMTPQYSYAPLMCRLTPDYARYQHITVTVRDEVITALTFSSPSMRLIDLVWRWGPPDYIITQDNNDIAWWQNRAHAFARVEGHYRLHTPVRYLVITDDSLSDFCAKMVTSGGESAAPYLPCKKIIRESSDSVNLLFRRKAHKPKLNVRRSVLGNM